MRKRNLTSLALALIAVVLCATETKAQAKATANAGVTLTVIPAPGMNFSSAAKNGNVSSTVMPGAQFENTGMTFQSLGNVMVQLDSRNSHAKRMNVKQGQVRTFTPNELKDVSEVEIVYLGSQGRPANWITIKEPRRSSIPNPGMCYSSISDPKLAVDNLAFVTIW